MENELETVQIGSATLYHGDSREILPTLQEDAVVITDPPYGIGFKYDGEYKDNGGESYTELIGILKGRKSVVLQYPEETMRYLVPILGVPDDCIAWCYNSNTNRQFRIWSFFGIKPNFDLYKIPAKNITDARVARMVRSYDWFDDCQQVKNVSSEKTEHPCQISVSMMERIISVSGADLIIDPFMGSGTTGEAALKLGRKFIGIEREKKYFDIACARLNARQAQQTLFAPEYQAPEQSSML